MYIHIQRELLTWLFLPNTWVGDTPFKKKSHGWKEWTLFPQGTCSQSTSSVCYVITNPCIFIMPHAKNPKALYKLYTQERSEVRKGNRLCKNPSVQTLISWTEETRELWSGRWGTVRQQSSLVLWNWANTRSIRCLLTDSRQHRRWKEK